MNSLSISPIGGNRTITRRIRVIEGSGKAEGQAKDLNLVWSGDGGGIIDWGGIVMGKLFNCNMLSGLSEFPTYHILV